MAVNEESLHINKERTWVFSPVNNVVFKVTIKGEVTSETLEAAIRIAAEKQALFQYYVSVDEKGEAHFAKGAKWPLQVEETDKDWQEVLKEEEKKPFNIWQGEFMRLFILPQQNEEEKQLLLIAHHIAGDGLSYTYFIQDVMHALDGEKVPERPLKLFAMSDLPKESKLSFIMQILMKRMNKKWKKTQIIFDKADYEKMYDKYWQVHSSYVMTHCIKKEAFYHLLEVAKANAITVNTLLMTSFLKAAKEKCSVGYAVSIREKGYEGMGNYATGLSVDYLFDERKSFFENAKIVQTLIKKKLSSPKKKYFLLQFLGAITGTLQDAVYFSAIGECQDATAKTFSRMFGYDGNPKGISMTNLTKVPIAKDYGKWQLCDLTFIPPLVLNSQRILGIASLGDEMVITCHLDQNDHLEQHIAFFEEGINIISRL